MTFRFNILGAGAVGPGFDSFTTFCAQLGDDAVDLAAPTPTPKPGVIPPRERRRAPLIVKLAVEAASQACAAAELEPDQLATVFASAMGDTAITDYMCRAVAAAPIVLSPTRFHNSVHNAAAGYWTISTGCAEASNSVAAGPHTFGVALLEALCQSQQERRPILLVTFDAHTPAPFEFLAVERDFASALVVDAADQGHWHATLNSDEGQRRSAQASILCAAALGSNPAAHSLSLLHNLSGVDRRQPLAFSVGQRQCLTITEAIDD